MKRAAFLVLTVALAACQGSVGSTPPIGPPNGVAPNTTGQVQGVGGPGASRAQTQEAVIKYSKDLTTVAFPSTEGYGLQIVIGSPTPAPSPSPSVKASASPAASGSPAVSPSPSASAKATSSPSPAPSVSPTPKRTPAPPITVKLTVYPDLAPVGPTPDPDASPAPTPIANRTAVVRGYFKTPVTFTVSSLDAFRFTLPADEIDKTRGFTIALFVVPDKNKVAQSLFGSHKDPSTLLQFTTAATVDSGDVIHAGTKGSPIQLYAGTGYAVILYADPRAVAGPAAAPQGGYVGAGQPGAPAQGVPPGSGIYGQQGPPSPLPFNQTPPAGAYPQATAQGSYPNAQTPSPYPTPYH